MNGGMNAGDPLEWYMDIPVVSRAYLTLAFATTAACALDIVSPYSLYFNYTLIWNKGQLWRLLTNFLFFGTFGIDFIFHMYFMCRYSRLLEEHSFRGRTADFVWMLLLGAAIMVALAPFLSVHFLGSSLSTMMVYVWGRRNRYERLSFLGLFPFTAPYLPWVLLTFSLLLGGHVMGDAIGIGVGHVYFYLEDVFPAIADARGWKRRKLLPTPSLIHHLCGTQRRQPDAVQLNNAPGAMMQPPVVPQANDAVAQADAAQAAGPAAAAGAMDNEAPQQAVEAMG